MNQRKLSYLEYERYAKQIILDEIQHEGQNRIKHASVACIGAGGLNSSTLLYLTACGIGKINIIDNDTVELSNLQRQVLYRENNIGEQKAEVACKTLISLNPLVKLESCTKKLTKENIENTLSKYKIIIDGTDNIKTRYLISQYCYQSHKVHIYGAIEKFTGHISTFNYQNSAQYYNLYNKISYAKHSACSDIGIMNTLAGMVGLLQATEAIKIITGIGKTTANQLIVFNLLSCSVNKIKIRPGKLINQKITRIHAENKLLRSKHVPEKIIVSQKKQLYKVIDVRTSLEFNIDKKENAVNIPLSQLKKHESMKCIKKLLRKYKIVIYCKNTARSYIAYQMLHRQSIDSHITNLKLD